MSAERAIATILGGEPAPSEDEGMTAAQMSEWLLAADKANSHNSYDEAARYTAKLILEYFIADPRHASIPTETKYDWQGDPDGGVQGMKPEFVEALGLYDAMKSDGIDLGELGLTGFQWGWAVNAARRCVELGPAPNPAIVDIG